MTQTPSLNDKSQWIETIWKALHSYRGNFSHLGISERDQEWVDICTAMSLVTQELGHEQIPAIKYPCPKESSKEQDSDIDIKAWREARKITQEQAAEILGVSPRHIQRLEAGTNRLTPTLDRLMRLL